MCLGAAVCTFETLHRQPAHTPAPPPAHGLLAKHVILATTCQPRMWSSGLKRLHCDAAGTAVEAEPVLSTPPTADRPQQQQQPEAVSVEPRSAVLQGAVDVGPIPPYIAPQGGLHEGLYGQGLNGPVGGMQVCRV